MAGFPQTPFHNASVTGEQVASDPARVRKSLEKALAKGRGEADIFGMRLQMHSFPHFIEDLGLLHPELPTDRQRIQAVFGAVLCIHLTRTDKLAQAVSYVRATQTGLWHRAPDGSEIERLSPPAEPYFDADAIRTELETFEAYDNSWRDWFARESLRPVTLTYEALAQDPISTVRSLLSEMHLDETAADSVGVTTAKLADATSEDWMKRYRALIKDA